MIMLYEITGSGRPLVLVPGGLTGWSSWIPIAERLAPSRKVVRVQLLSVQLGLENAPLPPGYSIRMEADALGAALADAGLEPPVDFAAWSFGGGVLMRFLLDHPEWARTAAFIEPEVPWVRPELDPATRAQRDLDLRLSRENIREEDLAGFVRRAGLVPPGADPREVDSWPTMVKFRQSLRAIPAVWENVDDPARLARLTAPCLLVKGIGSTSNDIAMVDTLDKLLPNSRVVELPGGHAAHLVSTDDFLAHMHALHSNA